MWSFSSLSLFEFINRLRSHRGVSVQRTGNTVKTGCMLSMYGTDCPELQAHKRHLLLQTEALLARPGQRWQTRTIATALLERRTLSEEDVLGVLRAASAKP